MIGHSGLGDAQNLDKAYNTAAATAMAIGAATGPVGAAIGAAVAASIKIAQALHIGYGCGPTCVQATQLVNDAEPLFRNNVALYEGGQIDQATAQYNYSQLWDAVVRSCGAIDGDAGKKCVTDRQAGSCKYKQIAEPKYPGEPKLGECWNWDAAYHQPLLLESLNPVGASGTVGGTLDSVTSTLTSNPMLLVGVGLLAVGLMSSSKGGN